MNIDMKAISKLQTAADVAFAAWKGPGAYALKNHASYSAALKANTAAANAYEALRSYTQGVFDALEADTSWYTDYNGQQTHNEWLAKIGAIRDSALQNLNLLASVRGQIVADMAAHIQVNFGPTDQAKLGGLVHTNPEAAAGAVDKADKATGNPNDKTPGTQDTSAPPVDAPPPADTPWGMIAIGAAAGLLVLKLVWR